MNAIASGLRIGTEPMTAWTDAILCAWTAFLAARLFAQARGVRAVTLWGWGFVGAAAGSLAGAIFHGCRIHFTPIGMAISWKLVPITTGIAALCLGWAAATAWLAPRARRIVVAILWIEFIACLVAAALSNSFVVVAVDYLPVLIAILIGAIARRVHWIAAGILVSFIAIGFQLSSVHIAGLDHNDIFHVIQAAAMFLLYRGGVMLSEAIDVEAMPRPLIRR